MPEIRKTVEEEANKAPGGRMHPNESLPQKSEPTSEHTIQLEAMRRVMEENREVLQRLADS